MPEGAHVTEMNPEATEPEPGDPPFFVDPDADDAPEPVEPEDHLEPEDEDD